MTKRFGMVTGLKAGRGAKDKRLHADASSGVVDVMRRNVGRHFGIYGKEPINLLFGSFAYAGRDVAAFGRAIPVWTLLPRANVANIGPAWKTSFTGIEL